MYEGSGQQNMAIKMIYTDANGTDHYDQVAAAQATAGQWVEMKGNYTVPNGATGMILYVEMPNAGTDQTYYIDDVVIKGERQRFSWTTSLNPTSTTTPPRSGTAVAVPRWNSPPSTPTAARPACMSPAEPSCGTVRPAVCLTSWKPAATTKSAHTFSMTATSTPTPRNFPSTCSTTSTARKTTTPLPPRLQTRANGKYVGSEFTVPEGATNFYVYVQTGYTSAPKEQDLMNFYMDDAVGEHLPDPAIQDDIASLKDAYSDYFKIGCACAGSEFAQAQPRTSSKNTTTV